MMGRVKYGLAAGFLAILTAGPAMAQQKQANIKAGQEVALFHVCKFDGGSASLSGTASNGTTRVMTQPSRQCGANGEVTRILYKPNPGFRGTDTAYIYYWGQRWDIIVNVR